MVRVYRGLGLVYKRFRASVYIVAGVVLKDDARAWQERAPVGSEGGCVMS